jgi:arylsulfatase A-like enzyme
LNGYDSTYEPPGWDSWDAEIVGDSSQGGYYDYNMSVDGRLVYYGTDDSDYSTDVLAGYATKFIRSAPSGRPLFLYFAPHAPHAPATPPARYRQSLRGLSKYRPPNFNEADMSDKPTWAQQLPLLTRREIRSLDHFRVDQFRSLLAVDDAIAGILSALSEKGRLADTMLVFMSDNGLELGSHRWIPKAVPWDEAIRVPLVIRYDPLTGGSARVDDHIALNIDLAPTFAAVGRVSAPGAEGSSLLPVLAGTLPEWREGFLLEHLPGGQGDPGSVPSYCGVRTSDYAYVQYEETIDGHIQVEEELYDLNADGRNFDPYELANLAGDDAFAEVKAQLHQRMVQLCSPPPPGFIP